MKNKSSLIAALGGMITAASLVLMLLTRVVPFSEMIFPAIAGVLLIPAVFELGTGWSAAAYAATGLLSLIFTFQNGAAFYYICFFGLYTIIKNHIEHLRKRPLQWAAKLVFFNLSASALYFIIAAAAGLPGFVTKYGVPIALVLANVMFVVYDIALSRLIVIYAVKMRKKVIKK